MKLEEQVTNLKLSKQLKKLGVLQESYFDWIRHTSKSPYSLEGGTWETKDKFGRISAFTVAELGKHLPYQFMHDNKSYRLEVLKFPDALGKNIVWCCFYTSETDNILVRATSMSLADCFGNIVGYLIENKFEK